MLSKDRLIVALDVPSAAQARQLVQSIGESASTYKIGKQLFTAEGPELVRELVASGRKVFLDLKFHDIPNTVGAAVRSAAELRVSMLTVHASGGSKMLKAAAEAATQSSAKPMVLAVTVLTSMSDTDLQEIGVAGRPEPGTAPGSACSPSRLRRSGGLGERSRRAAPRIGRRFRDRHARSTTSRIRCGRSGTSGDTARRDCSRRKSPGGRPSDHRSARSGPGSRYHRRRDGSCNHAAALSARLGNRCRRTLVTY